MAEGPPIRQGGKCRQVSHFTSKFGLVLGMTPRLPEVPIRITFCACLLKHCSLSCL